jgi:hypothetical protein
VGERQFAAGEFGLRRPHVSAGSRCRDHAGRMARAARSGAAGRHRLRRLGGRVGQSSARNRRPPSTRMVGNGSCPVPRARAAGLPAGGSGGGGTSAQSKAAAGRAGRAKRRAGLSGRAAIDAGGVSRRPHAGCRLASAGRIGRLDVGRRGAPPSGGRGRIGRDRAGRTAIAQRVGAGRHRDRPGRRVRRLEGVAAAGRRRRRVGLAGLPCRRRSRPSDRYYRPGLATRGAGPHRPRQHRLRKARDAGGSAGADRGDALSRPGRCRVEPSRAGRRSAFHGGRPPQGLLQPGRNQPQPGARAGARVARHGAGRADRDRSGPRPGRRARRRARPPRGARRARPRPDRGGGRDRAALAGAAAAGAVRPAARPVRLGREPGAGRHRRAAQSRLPRRPRANRCRGQGTARFRGCRPGSCGRLRDRPVALLGNRRAARVSRPSGRDRPVEPVRLPACVVRSGAQGCGPAARRLCRSVPPQ